MADDGGSLGPADRALGALAVLSLAWAVLTVVAPPPRPTYAGVKAALAAEQAARESEISRLQGSHPWAGRYLGGNELWVGPAGFALKTDPKRTPYMGTVRDLGGRLHLTFEANDLTSTDGLSYYHVVPWGRRVYLVESTRLGDFVESVNAGFEPRRVRRGSFYLRDGDWLAPAAGKPLLPADESRRLLPSPIEARILRSEPGGRAQYDYLARTCLTLDAGRAAGVRPGVKFYLIKDTVLALENLSLTIDSVSDRTSTAVFETYKDSSPRPGWRLSTRFHEPRIVDTVPMCGGMRPEWPTDWMLADGYGN